MYLVLHVGRNGWMESIQLRPIGYVKTKARVLPFQFVSMHTSSTFSRARLQTLPQKGVNV